MCVPLSGSTIKRCDKFVELDLICVELRGVDARVAHKPAECTNVASRLRRLHSPRDATEGDRGAYPDSTSQVSRRGGRLAVYSAPADVLETGWPAVACRGSWTGKLGRVAPSASSRLARVAGRDFLREAQGRTLTKGQILDSIARVVENMAERDKDWSRLAEQLHAVLVDPEFDLDAPVDLADLMAVITEHYEAEPPEPPVEAPRRDEFPGGPQ